MLATCSECMVKGSFTPYLETGQLEIATCSDLVPVNRSTFCSVSPAVNSLNENFSDISPEAKLSVLILSDLWLISYVVIFSTLWAVLFRFRNKMVTRLQLTHGRARTLHCTLRKFNLNGPWLAILSHCTLRKISLNGPLLAILCLSRQHQQQRSRCLPNLLPFSATTCN